MTSHPHLYTLPNGSLVSLGAIHAIEARMPRHPIRDAAGHEYPALVVIETRNQILRVPCTSGRAALALRDEIGALVNDHRADAAAQRARDQAKIAGSLRSIAAEPGPAPAEIAS